MTSQSAKRRTETNIKSCLSSRSLFFLPLLSSIQQSKKNKGTFVPSLHPPPKKKVKMKLTTTTIFATIFALLGSGLASAISPLARITTEQRNQNAPTEPSCREHGNPHRIVTPHDGPASSTAVETAAAEPHAKRNGPWKPFSGPPPYFRADNGNEDAAWQQGLQWMECESQCGLDMRYTGWDVSVKCYDCRDRGWTRGMVDLEKLKRFITDEYIDAARRKWGRMDGELEERTRLLIEKKIEETKRFYVVDG